MASGANESEIYIWDLNNFATPMTPGVKTQVPDLCLLNSSEQTHEKDAWQLSESCLRFAVLKQSRGHRV